MISILTLTEYILNTKDSIMKNIEAIDVVLGCSFGDEGKGKVTFDLLKNNKYNLCVRFNGSGNAGHTIYYQNKKFVLHQLPIGVLFDSVYNLISSDCLVNINKLKEEIDELTKMGIHITERLYISSACHIITKECLEYDQMNNKIGTTGSGIGPTYANKMLRIGIRADSFVKELSDLGIQVVNQREFWKSDFVNQNIKTVLLEGAQGFELDINWTQQYPYCTSSNCTISGALNTGVPLKKVRNIYGVSKIYDTYVGTLNFEPVDDLNLQKIGDAGKEYGATTGRRRQCNYLNLDNLKDALTFNQCNVCIMNKVDILEQVGVYKMYSNGELLNFETLTSMKDYIKSQLDFVDIVFSSNPYCI